jgi:sulfate transport system permease protein
MSTSIALDIRHARVTEATSEPRAVRWLLIGTALLFLTLFLLVPLLAVFTQAFARVCKLISLPCARRTRFRRSSSLVAAGIAVPLNLIFGVAAAWAITKFDFGVRACLSRLSICRSPYHR